MALQDILERKETLLKPNDMTNEEKAQEICEKNKQFHVKCSSLECYLSAMEMAKWKDEQYKTAYVVTRSDLHYDEVEKVFFDKSKAEEYCKFYNEDENSYHRNITEIEVSL